MFEVSFSQASRLNFFFLLVSALSGWSSGLYKLLIVWNFVYLFIFPLMGKAEWGGNPVCWWFGLYFCCLDEVSCTGCSWWLGDAGSCIQVVSFVCILTIWNSLGVILWYSRVMESVLPLQRLRAWSLVLHVRMSLPQWYAGACLCQLGGLDCMYLLPIQHSVISSWEL